LENRKNYSLGSSYQNKVKLIMNKIAVLLVGVIFSVHAYAELTLPIWTGDWKGVAKTANEETTLILKITESNSQLQASISLNDVGVSGWPASFIAASSDKLHVELPSDSGIQKMDFTSRDGTLIGKWQEPNRDEVASILLQKINTPDQNTEKKVLINGPAGKIGASIFTPKERKQCQTIVFLHGSGPQSRDANRFAARRFAELGIASIIYDKRGVGESEGTLSGITFEDLAADAIAVAEYMLLQTPTSKIGFSGHSQGGWISTLAASKWAKTAFVITSSGPAVAPSREAHWTVVRAMRKNNSSKLAIQKARSVIDDWHTGVRTGNWSAFEKSYALAEKQPWFSNSELMDFAEKPSAQDAHSYRAFMDYDPMPAIKSLRMPYLAILSPEDESIDAMETKEILEQLQQSNITIKLYPGYDHSMRKLGENGKKLRWPEHPEKYFEDQYKFLSSFDNCPAMEL
jgi:uncharacterized protein